MGNKNSFTILFVHVSRISEVWPTKKTRALSSAGPAEAFSQFSTSRIRARQHTIYKHIYSSGQIIWNDVRCDVVICLPHLHLDPSIFFVSKYQPITVFIYYNFACVFRTNVRSLSESTTSPLHLTAVFLSRRDKRRQPPSSKPVVFQSRPCFVVVGGPRIVFVCVCVSCVCKECCTSPRLGFFLNTTHIHYTRLRFSIDQTVI